MEYYTYCVFGCLCVLYAINEALSYNAHIRLDQENKTRTRRVMRGIGGLSKEYYLMIL